MSIVDSIVKAGTFGLVDDITGTEAATRAAQSGQASALQAQKEMQRLQMQFLEREKQNEFARINTLGNQWKYQQQQYGKQLADLGQQYEQALMGRAQDYEAGLGQALSRTQAEQAGLFGAGRQSLTGLGESLRGMYVGSAAGLGGLTHEALMRTQGLMGSGLGSIGGILGGAGRTMADTAAPYESMGLGALQNMGDLAGSPLNVDLAQDPGYQFRLQEGQRALGAQQSARGMLQSGAAQKELARFSQGLASQEYGAAYNRAAASRGERLGALGTLGQIGSGLAGQRMALGTHLAGQQAGLTGSLYGQQAGLTGSLYGQQMGLGAGMTQSLANSLAGLGAAGATMYSQQAALSPQWSSAVQNLTPYTVDPRVAAQDPGARMSAMLGATAGVAQPYVSAAAQSLGQLGQAQSQYHQNMGQIGAANATAGWNQLMGLGQLGASLYGAGAAFGGKDRVEV